MKISVIRNGKALQPVDFENGLPRIGEIIELEGMDHKVKEVRYIVFHTACGFFSKLTIIVI